LRRKNKLLMRAQMRLAGGGDSKRIKGTDLAPHEDYFSGKKATEVSDIPQVFFSCLTDFNLAKM
jgi:hypothetical protein